MELKEAKEAACVIVTTFALAAREPHLLRDPQDRPTTKEVHRLHRHQRAQLDLARKVQKEVKDRQDQVARRALRELQDHSAQEPHLLRDPKDRPTTKEVHRLHRHQRAQLDLARKVQKEVKD